MLLIVHKRIFVEILKNYFNFLFYFILFNLPVTAKLRSLHDFHLRLLTNQPPFPTGGDIANTLKYFSATLLSEYFHALRNIYIKAQPFL